ncbi:MAG: YopX family protein [Firmicutes bacterium]|nr:YopX family protein [Bacillota bacterium]
MNNQNFDRYLFREKSGGDWCIGSLILPDSKDDCYYIAELDDECLWFPVDPATIGQSTGIFARKDNSIFYENGKLIFVGDIVQNLLGTSTGVVKHGHCRPKMFEDWCNTYASGMKANLICTHISWLNGNSTVLSNVTLLRVIGNVHDNPELLQIESEG